MTGSVQINLTRTTFDDAEATCMRNGSHLISYANNSMQRAVEQLYLDAGILIPSFHGSYWIGLNTTAAMWRNRWTWVDSSSYELNVTYQNWGLYQPGGNPEPNNITGSEFCAVANASQPARNAWGWSDTKCSNRNIFMCYYPRKPLSRPCRCFFRLLLLL
jgi:hypothetical protein